MAFGFRHEPGQGQQIAALFLREAGEVRAIRFDGSQYVQAGAEVIIGNVHARIVEVPGSQ